MAWVGGERGLGGPLVYFTLVNMINLVIADLQDALDVLKVRLRALQRPSVRLAEGNGVEVLVGSCIAIG